MITSKYKWLRLGLVLLIGLLAVWFIPGLRSLFDLRPMPPTHYLVMAVGAILWGLLLRWIWRAISSERCTRSCPRSK